MVFVVSLLSKYFPEDIHPALKLDEAGVLGPVWQEGGLDVGEHTADLVLLGQRHGLQTFHLGTEGRRWT